MKNEMKILNTYINNVCKGIRDRKVKNELKDELLSHLLEIYERNIALGLSDEEAQKDAVAHMGDSEAVSKTFKKIYPVSSAEYFKYTGKLLALGLIFSMLNITSYRGLNAMFGFSVVLQSALDRIKNINNTLHKAYILSYINSVLQTIFLVCRHNFLIDEKIVIVFSIILNATIIVPYIFTIIGLIGVRKQLGENKPYIGLGIISIFAIVICFSITTIQLYIDRIELCFLAAFISLFPAGFMYVISEDDIDRLNTGIPGEKKTSIKRILLGIIIMAIGISSIFTAELFTYHKPIEYITDDINKNVNEIRNNLVNLGLPENIANELPESEILKYCNATDLQIVPPTETFLTDTRYTSYNFILDNNENLLIVRSLMIIDEFDNFNESSYTEFYIDYYYYDSSEIFCKFLCNYDGVTREIPPIKSAPIEDKYDDYDFKDYHFVFPNTKNAKIHRAYISMTFEINISTETEEYLLTHYYAQSSLSDINNPYKSYIHRNDDRLYIKIKNPYYINDIDKHSSNN